MLAPQNCQPATCPGCQGPALTYTLLGRQFIECGPCYAAEQARREAETRRKRAVAVWEAQTPADMAKTLNWASIAPKLRHVQTADETRGIALVGKTDTGKTRLGYWLLKKLAVYHGVTGRLVRHTDLRKAASSTNHNNKQIADAATTLIESCRSVPCLVLDDIGKGATTETADEVFFDLLTHRRDNNLLTHWTANAGSDWLARRFGSDRGPAIITRLARISKGQVFVQN
jgi:DNA replication protein DnaC